MTDRARRIAALAMLLAAGVFAGAQLGKIAPLIPYYRDELGFSLVFIGWLTSTIGIFVALAALPTSLAIDRVGQFRVLAAGSAVLLAGGLGIAAFAHPALILFFRAVEAIGYLVLVIVIPAILNGVSPPALRAPMLAIWGGFVPVGFAVADFMAASMVGEGNATSFLLAVTLCFGALALGAGLLLSRIGDETLLPAPALAAPGLGDSLSGAVALIAIAFGFYVVLSLAFFAFLPAAAARDGGTLLVSAGLVALLVPAGNALASVAMSGRALRAAVMLGAAGFVVSAATAIPAFASTDPLTVTLAAILFAVAGGVTASALFASVPFIIPAAGSASVVIGVICQAGGITTLIGPPIAGHVIESFGWTGFGWFLVATSLAGLALLAPLFGRRG